jgi:phosphoesterase RecJ-like protein
VDTGEKSRIGRVKPLVDHLKLAIVDHHPPGGDPLTGVDFRDPNASATGELVFDLVYANGGPWTPSVVQGLYIAILTDTGSFRFSNATASAHRTVAELISYGASPDGLYRAVYGDVPLRRYRLLREALDTLERSAEAPVAWMTVPDRAFRDLGCTSEDIEGMVDFPRGLEGVEVGLLVREIESGQVKVSFRSNGFADVNALARSFGGGGHVRASGALVRGELREVMDRVVRGAMEAARTSGASTAAEPDVMRGVIQ